MLLPLICNRSCEPFGVIRCGVLRIHNDLSAYYYVLLLEGAIQYQTLEEVVNTHMIFACDVYVVVSH